LPEPTRKAEAPAVAPAPSQKAEAPAAATPADGAVPAWAKVTQLQIDSAAKAGVPVAKELDLGGGVTMKLVLIPAGKFMMGSPDSEQGHSNVEGLPQEVAISKPFYMGVTEVTQAQYEAVIGTNPSTFKGETNPVEMVSWNDATEFCKKLSEKTRQAVRLPTEAEWEYACRAGTATAFSFGDVRQRPWRLCMVRCQQRHHDASCRPEKAERLGPLRHARECVGMVRGSVQSLF
jgi:formylglycine-generating enzyme required for sulfatase activity